MDTIFASHSTELRKRLCRASQETFTRCVDTAITEKVDALLIAGDLFDSTRISFATESFLHKSLSRLSEAGVQVVYATGNHDPGGIGRASSVLRALSSVPNGLTVIDRAQPKTVPILDRTGETIGFVVGAGHESHNETRNLAAHFKPVPETALPQVALLHTQTANARHASQHQRYAPSQLATLQNAGFHYWALGHVHQRQCLSERPAVHYPGNLIGRNPKETGAKGGLLVDVSNPDRPKVQFCPLAPVRWEKITMPNLAETKSFEALLQQATQAWEAARAKDATAGETGGSVGTPEWVVVVELEGPSPLWNQIVDEIEVLETGLADRIGVLEVTIRSEGLFPEAQVEEHFQRKDVLGVALRLAQAVRDGEEDLSLGAEDFAGFESVRDGTLKGYLQRLLNGVPEEVVARMLPFEDSPR